MSKQTQNPVNFSINRPARSSYQDYINDTLYNLKITESVSIGIDAAKENQQVCCIAIGKQAGRYHQGWLGDSIDEDYVGTRGEAIAIGCEAGKTEQFARSIAIGAKAGYESQGLDNSPTGPDFDNFGAIAIGHTAGMTIQRSESIAIGFEAGKTNQGVEEFFNEARGGGYAMGYRAGYTDQTRRSVAIGSYAGHTNQGNTGGADCVAIGTYAGQFNQSNNGVAISWNAGRYDQRNNSVAIGYYAGHQNQGTGGDGRAVSIGYSAGRNFQTQNSIAIGPNAGRNYQGISGGGIAQGSSSANFWDDWGNDIFDDWGFFYIYDPSSNVYYFPELFPNNLDDGIQTVQTFSAFGRNFTIKHGYPIQGIFKFEITCDDSGFPFVFGGYGDMGSDSNTMNTNETGSYVLNSQTYTLFYNRNVEENDEVERFFSYFIPYETSQNFSKTYYDFLSDSDELSLFSVPVTQGITVYFSKQYDVKDWVMWDLIIDEGNRIVSQNMTTNPNGYQLGGYITKDMDFGPVDGLEAQKSPSILYAGGVGTAIAVGDNAGNESQAQNSIAIGTDSGRTNKGVDSISIGTNSGESAQGQSSVAIGVQAGNQSQSLNGVAIGTSSGQSSQGQGAIAIGVQAGNQSQSLNGIAIGTNSGQNSQEQNCIAIGKDSGNNSQRLNSIAIGNRAGNQNQGITEEPVGGHSIAIGFEAGYENQGDFSIAIGAYAGYQNQPDNSIVLNASETQLNPTNSGLFVDPVTQRDTNEEYYTLHYRPSTKEVIYGLSNNATPGIIQMFAGSSAPHGFLLCDGSAISRWDFANLFAVIGTTYGAGDGVNTFNLPNLKGRVPVGRDASQTEFDGLGETGGEKTHTLTIAEMPSHTHTYLGVQSQGAASGLDNVAENSPRPTETSGSTGGSQAHNNLQPYIVLNYIITY